MTTRTTVLLGAGASKESGLMLASELSHHLVRQLNGKAIAQGDGLVPWLRALNFTYGAMLSHSSEEGFSPLDGVNIERLVSALRLLQERHSHEAAPFVSLWKEGVKGFRSTELPSGRHEDLLATLKHALELPTGESSMKARRPAKWALAKPLAHQIARIAREATGPPSVKVFKEAEGQLLLALARHLESFQEVEYLDPIGALAQETDTGLDVLTLNYDTTLEEMALTRGVSVETGLLHWKPGHQLDFHADESKLRLYKLHGSVDWEYRRGDNTAQPPEIVERDSEIDDPEEEWDENEPAMPWVVVGDREKLSTDGPTLPLLRAAERALSQSARLVVVGYSFGDDHINFMIRNWMAGDRTRELRIVDPYWTPRSIVNSFKQDLLTQYVEDPDPGWGSRVQVFKGETQHMLAPALTAPSRASGAEAFEIEVLESVHSDGVEARLKYSGPGLSSLRIEAKQQQPGEPGEYLQRSVFSANSGPGRRYTSFGLPTRVTVEDVSPNQELHLYIERDGSEALVVDLTAFPHNIAGRTGWRQEIELALPHG